MKRRSETEINWLVLEVLRRISRICFIVDSKDIDHAVSVALRSGIKWIQYREKELNKRAIYLNALRIRELTNRFDASLIINDYVDIALAVDADGVHLGQDDLPLNKAKKIMGDKIVGISTHNIQEAIEAERGGADYIGFGSIFHTNTKKDTIISGLNGLKEVVKAVKIPVIAIGGIDADNVIAVLETGCYGIACSTGIKKGQIKDNINRFLSILYPTMSKEDQNSDDKRA